MIRTAGLFNCVYARGGDVLEKQRDSQTDACCICMPPVKSVVERER
jgi:hypothetical protein